jgi:small subunit ribosomal protein S2
MSELLEAGAHFGHQTRRWDPAMKPYIYGQKSGIHIIDLQQTLGMFETACQAVLEQVARGSKVLFVGTKRQAQNIIKEEAERCGMFFVNHRWLGGTLTNFRTIKNSIDMLKQIERIETEGKFGGLTKKEALQMSRKRVKLEAALAGIKEMGRLPDILFVVDIRREKNAVKEAQDLGLRIIAPVDSNCNPNIVDYPIPGNDDSMRAIRLYASRVADACLEGARRSQDLEKEEEKKEEGASPPWCGRGRRASGRQQWRDRAARTAGRRRGGRLGGLSCHRTKTQPTLDRPRKSRTA